MTSSATLRAEYLAQFTSAGFKVFDPVTHGLPRVCPTFVGGPGNNGHYWWCINYPELDAILLATCDNQRFFLAHEIGHATGAPHRAGRNSLRRYPRSRLALRVEETIADRIAAYYGLPRPEGDDWGWYAAAPPWARTYIETHTARAIEWLEALGAAPLENVAEPTFPACGGAGPTLHV